ncbi:uncharacterized protein LOC120475661 isoform X1 [Pimephales promelas]|uniref:uncharacterized protein LOC120475661 isoform X1 n=1 Tax=Pimephales promelas TaxID=90988 RepID=UPI001955A6EC|nr:uncharacterized protein LOC120475661 isoform X1 [Pimephales promelas]XP_039522252.1 uncharacterized protein LOC120475661 isoform X1 [Pimephales promelas]
MNLSEKPSEILDSHVSSSVSVKSDHSKNDGPTFSEKKTSSTKRVRAGSYLSSVSMTSDQSKDDGPTFREKTPYNKSEILDSHVSSSVSVKSDHSKNDGPTFSEKKTSSTKSWDCFNALGSCLSCAVRENALDFHWRNCVIRDSSLKGLFTQETLHVRLSSLHGVYERSSSHLSSVSMKSDQSKDDGPTFSEKTPYNKRVRSGSRLSSVSMKSDQSKDDGPTFREKTPCNKSEISDSHVSSSVSVKSDHSKNDGPTFSEKKTSSTKRVRSGSYLSSVSMKSDQSKDDGPTFSEKTPCNKSERLFSRVSSSVSVESDHSKNDGPTFSEKKTSSTKRVRAGSYLSSVSMKSDQSKDDGPTFSEKTPCNKSNKGQNTTVNIGAEFKRWEALKAQKELKSDVELATFLLNRVQSVKSDSDLKNQRFRKNFKENLLWIFKLPVMPSSTTSWRITNQDWTDFIHASDVLRWGSSHNPRHFCLFISFHVFSFL